MQIYKVTNLVNGKIYIGQDSFDRKDYLGSGKLINRAIEKYGIENFEKIVLEQCENKHELNDREKYWIAHYESTNPSIGYNIRIGGEGIAAGSKLEKNHCESIKRAITAKWEDEEYRKKMKQMNENSISNKTGMYSPETVAKAAKSRKGYKHDDLTIQLFREQHKGKHVGDKNPMSGRSFYDVWVEKYGKEEADRKKAEFYTSRKTSKKSPYAIWVEKYGKEEADLRMKKREKLRQESFRITQEKKKNGFNT